MFPTQSNTHVSNERHLQRFVVVLTMVSSDGLIKAVAQPGGKKSSFVFTHILVKTTICDFFCIKNCHAYCTLFEDKYSNSFLFKEIYNYRVNAGSDQ